MNEKLLRAIWKSQGFDQKGIPFEEFQNDIQNPKLQEAIYKSAGFESRGIKLDEFRADLGFDTTSTEIPVVSIPEEPVQAPVGQPTPDKPFGDADFLPSETPLGTGLTQGRADVSPVARPLSITEQAAYQKQQSLEQLPDSGAC